MIITKYYPHGSLKRIIELQRQNQLTISFNITNKLIISYGIASVCLHSKDIIHCDLKPLNVLFYENVYPVFVDFDKNLQQEENSEDQILGAPLYFAPEIWNGLPYTKKSDVYSYGMLVYDLFTDQNSFEKLDSSQLCFKECSLGLNRRLICHVRVNNTFQMRFLVMQYISLLCSNSNLELLFLRYQDISLTIHLESIQ